MSSKQAIDSFPPHAGWGHGACSFFRRLGERLPS
jgi:hypothetical protein